MFSKSNIEKQITILKEIFKNFFKIEMYSLGFELGDQEIPSELPRKQLYDPHGTIFKEKSPGRFIIDLNLPGIKYKKTIDSQIELTEKDLEYKKMIKKIFTTQKILKLLSIESTPMWDQIRYTLVVSISLKKISKYVKQLQNENFKYIKQLQTEKFKIFKNFNIEKNETNIFGNNLKFDIKDQNDKIGYFILSQNEFDYLEIEEDLGGKSLYLSFIFIENNHRGKGHFEKIMDWIKQYAKNNNFEYVVLRIDEESNLGFDKLQNKYEKMGFISFNPDNIHEFSHQFNIDPNDKKLFMYYQL